MKKKSKKKKKSKNWEKFKMILPVVLMFILVIILVHLIGSFIEKPAEKLHRDGLKKIFQEIWEGENK